MFDKLTEVIKQNLEDLKGKFIECNDSQYTVCDVVEMGFRDGSIRFFLEGLDLDTQEKVFLAYVGAGKIPHLHIKYGLYCDGVEEHILDIVTQLQQQVSS